MLVEKEENVRHVDNRDADGHAHKLLLAQREGKQRRSELAPLLEAVQGQVVGAHADADGEPGHEDARGLEYRQQPTPFAEVRATRAQHVLAEHEDAVEINVGVLHDVQERLALDGVDAQSPRQVAAAAIAANAPVHLDDVGVDLARSAVPRQYDDEVAKGALPIHTCGRVPRKTWNSCRLSESPSIPRH